MEDESHLSGLAVTPLPSGITSGADWDPVGVTYEFAPWEFRDLRKSQQNRIARRAGILPSPFAQFQLQEKLILSARTKDRDFLQFVNSPSVDKGEAIK